MLFIFQFDILMFYDTKSYGCYGTNMQKMRRKNFFETRFELLGWEIGKNDSKKNSSAYLPDLPSPPGCS